MNKGIEAEIIDVFAAKHGISQSEAEAFVKHFADLLSEGLRKDRMVKVKGLGTFKVIEVKGRESVNVNNGERILIEGREKISFTPDAVMKDLVNKPFSQFDTVVLNEGVVFNDLKETTDYANDGGENLMSEPYEEAVEAPFPGDLDEEETVEIQPQPKLPDNDDVKTEETESKEEEILVEQPPVDNIEEPEHQVEEVVATVEEVVETPKEETPVDEEIPEESPAITPLMEDTAEGVVPEETIPEDSAEEDSIPENTLPEETNENETESAETDEEINNEDTEMKEKNIWSRVLSSLFVAVFAFVIGCFVGSKFAPKQHVANDESVAIVDTIPQGEGVDSARIKDSLRLAENAAIKAKADSVTRRNEQINDSLKKLQAQKKMEEANKKYQEELQAKKEKEAAKAEEAKPAPQPQTSGNQVLDRARLIMTHGAYRIIGTDQTITVRKGQTMQSIARTYLGSEMACYIQCHNNVAEVEEGMKLKIPKLELKKKKK